MSRLIMRPVIAIICLLFSLTAALGPKPPSVRPSGLTTYTPPTAGILDGTGFAAWVTTQANSGHKILALQPGAYHVNGSGYAGAHIFIAKLNGITIWMDGVNLTMTNSQYQAFQYYQCNNITTYGPTVWWDTPGFSQATITAVKALDATGRNFNITFRPDDGYNSSFLVNSTTGAFLLEYTDPKTGRLQAGPGWSNFKSTATKAPNNSWIAPLTNSYFHPIVGYKLLARGSALFCNIVTQSNNTVINDFTLLNCGGYGFFSTGSRSSTFNSFSIKPAPFAPPGGTELPARANSADGIHSIHDFVGPTIDSCLFSALDDDCIAVQGSLNAISSIVGSTNPSSTSSVSSAAVTSSHSTSGSYSTRTSTSTSASSSSLSPSQTANGQGPVSFVAPRGPAFVGALLRFYSATGVWNPLGTAKVTNVSSSSPRTITVDNMPFGVDTTSSWVNTNQVGSGFSITNTQAGNNRGRGAIIKASNGTIANNVFAGVAYAGIDIGPEFTSWTESDYVSNIVITNNTIDSCNYINKASAAFMLHGDGDNPINGNRNVTINGLTIRNTSASNFYIGATTGVNVRNVVFQDVYANGPNDVLWENWPGAVSTFENVSSVNNGARWGCIQGSIGRSGVVAQANKGNVTGVATLGSC